MSHRKEIDPRKPFQDERDEIEEGMGDDRDGLDPELKEKKEN